VFRDKFETLEHKFIPEIILSIKRKKPLWMTHKAHKIVSRKRQIYRKYKDTTHPAVIEASKAARREVKKAKKQFELKLAKILKRIGNRSSRMSGIRARVMGTLVPLQTAKESSLVIRKLKLKC